MSAQPPSQARAERDPLRALPLLPHPWALPRDRPRSLTPAKVWARVNETLVALSSLFNGDLLPVLQVAGGLTRKVVKQRWSAITRKQKDILKWVWDAHVRWGSSLADSSDQAALEGVLRAVPTAFRSGPPRGQDLGHFRGDLCPCVAEEVSLPPPGATPVQIIKLAPDAAEFLNNFKELMLRPDEDVGWEEYNALRPFLAPELKARRHVLQLLLRLWDAGMLGPTTEVHEEVSVFTVLKKYEDGKRSSILVWDLRRANLRWRKPPWVSLGSPISLCHLDLAPDLTEGRVLTACQGDLPNFFYLLEMPPEMWSWFVFADVTGDDLVKYAREQGRELSLPAGVR